MKYDVVLTAPARSDLLKITVYISDNLLNAKTADDFLKEVNDTSARLADMPLKYALVNDDLLKNLGIRMLRIKGYLAFYRVNEEKKMVTVLRIVHGKRDWQHILI